MARARRFLLALLFVPTLAFAETRYLVEFRGTPSAERFARFHSDLPALNKRGGTFVVRHELKRVFHGVAVTLDEAAVEAVRNLPYVAAVHVDKEVKAFATGPTPQLERIGAPKVWRSLGARGNGVTIAVIDSGVDRTHPAFAGRYVGGWDFVQQDAEPDDPHGHGTHVAGIALGEGFGVAPGAKLLAYRVLNEHGNGSSSDTMAAVERAVEEGADVINLSLGSAYGTANDPEARAIDRAMEAGVVVALAAGNTGGSQSIGTPATSRLGIVVGSADAKDAISLWSSYGPIYPDFELKPDVIAPGEDVLSARAGGGTVRYSGTSMASPHVAGAAALLLEVHPDWTPEQVKAALVATARPTAEEVMQRGAGLIDVYRAATATTFAAPASLSFGRMRGSDTEWSATRTVRVTATTAQAFHATFEPQPGIEIAVEPATFTLAAGESRDVTVAIRARDLPAVSRKTLAFGGAIAFGDTLRVPWVFVQAAAVTTTLTEPGIVFWSCGSDFHSRPPFSWPSFLTLLPVGDCTAVAEIRPFNDVGPAGVVLQTRPIHGDEEVTFTREQAPYRLAVAGVDEQGRLLRQQSGYGVQYHVHFGGTGPLRSLDFEQAPILSAMPDSVAIVAFEMVADLPTGRIVGVQHAPLLGMRGDHTFVNATTELVKTPVRVLPTSGELSVTILNSDGRPAAFGLPTVPAANGWSGELFLTPSKLPGYTAGPGFVTPVFRSEPILPSAEELVFGAKPLYPTLYLQHRESRFGFTTLFLGPQRELHHYVSARYEVRGAAGALVQSGYVDEPFQVVEYGNPGAYTLTLRGHEGGVTTYTFDTRRDDAFPPSLTSARVVGNDVLFTASEPVTSRVSHIDGQIRLEIVDTAGNSCTWTVPSAADGPGKRRTSRH